MALLRPSCPGLRLRHRGSLAHLLRRRRRSDQRPRVHIHSPDPHDAAQLAAVAAAAAAARAAPGGVICLCWHEVTVDRQPTPAPVWAGRGSTQPCAEPTPGPATPRRILAALHRQTGQGVRARADHVDVPPLVAFAQKLVAAYPPAERLYVVTDNLPVHFHPDLLVAFEAQETSFTPPLPPNWPTTPRPAALRRGGTRQLPIQLVPLPTYASWANPIEHLWRLLRQEVTHGHPFAADLAALRTALATFCARFAQPTPELLLTVGLGTSDT